MTTSKPKQSNHLGIRTGIKQMGDAASNRVPLARITSTALLSVIAVLLSACDAQPSAPADNSAEPTSQDAAPNAPASNEQLVFSAPENWAVTYRYRSDLLTLTEFSPPASEEMPQRFSVETYRMARDIDPLELLDGVSQEQTNICTHAQSYSLFAGIEAGFPTVVQLLLCGGDKISSQGQVTLIKVIDGQQANYVISQLWRVPAFKADELEPVSREQIAKAAQAMNRIQLCSDTNASDTTDVPTMDQTRNRCATQKQTPSPEAPPVS